MGIVYNPRVVTDGLVLALDAGNTKGYDKFENLMTNSQLGTTILNDGGAVTLTTDTTITNPFGGSDGVLKCVHTTNNPGYFRRGQNRSLTAGVTYTFSFYFKNGTVSNPYGQNANGGPSILVTTFSPTFQQLGQSLNTNIPVGNGWYRQVFTFTPSYTQTYQVDFNQAVNKTPIGTYYLYGFQLEIGSSVTDYYATTSTTKTRGTTWTDLSGNGNNGTLTNGPTFDSGNGGSIVFDGSNDYVNSTSTNAIVGNNPTQISLESWFKTNSTSVAYISSLKRLNTNSTLLSLTINQQSNSSTVQNYLGFLYDVGDTGGDNGVGHKWITTNENFYGKWTHICAVVNQSGAFLYINGVLRNQNLTDSFYGSNRSNPSANFTIGAFDASQLRLNGSIQTVKIYNRALTASEIQQNYNATKSRYQ